MMFDFIFSTIPGCVEIRPRLFEDRRGKFIKTYHREFFAQHGMNTDWREEYYSISRQGVLRGLHFQLPPHDHEKLVYCTFGVVLDVVVDLRKGSPTFKQFFAIELIDNRANMLYIPKGLAHGFCVLSDTATMIYKVSTIHAPKHDTGILWSSIGMEWPNKKLVLSDRDGAFVPLDEFDSPFIFEGEK